MTTMTAPATFQTITTGDKEGAAFLRRVVKDAVRLGYSDGWNGYASASTDWRVEFRRTIRGQAGDPDSTVCVRSDIDIRQYGRTGDEVKPFSDAKPVRVPQPRCVGLSSGDTAVLAKLALDGATFRVVASAGSTNSADHGLAFYYLEAAWGHYMDVQIGSQTVAKDGRVLTIGAVSL